MNPASAGFFVSTTIEVYMSTKLIDLREKRQKAIADAQAIKNKADAEKREMTADEGKAFDKAFAEAQDLRTVIEREERIVELAREDASNSEAAERAAAAKRGTPEHRKAKEVEGLRAYLAGNPKGITDEFRALQAGTDSSGGYLVLPEQYLAEVLKNVDNETFMRQLATKYTVVNAASLGVPYLSADPADTNWTSELLIGSEDSTMAFGKRSLTPHPLAQYIKVSEKLLRSAAIGAENLVRERLAYKMAVVQETAFMTGSGSGQPLGIFTASNDGIPTSRDYSTGNATDSPTFDGLIGAKYNVKGQYQSKGSWIFHRDCVAKIAKLKDGNGQYIWQPSKQVGDPDRLLGNPVYQSEYASNTFTTGLYVGVFGDFSKYWIVDALPLQIKRLDELFAATAQVGFVSRSECDAMPVLSEAFSRVKLG